VAGVDVRQIREALALAEQSPNLQNRWVTIYQLLNRWAATDPAAAKAWVTQSSWPEPVKSNMLKFRSSN
jgi:hypothetical protein